MNDILALIGLLVVIGIGYCILVGFNLLKTHSLFEKLPFAYGLGAGIVAWQLFAYSQLHIPWKLIYILGPWACLASIVIFIQRKIQILSPRKISFNPIDWILFSLIITTVIYVGFEVWLRPLYAWDGWAIWLIKSKLFFIDGFVNPNIYEILRDSYPFVVNLFGTFLYVFIGGVDDKSVLLLFYGYYLMLGIALYTLLKRQGLNNTKALVFTFLLLSLQNVIRHGGRFEAGYSDLPLGFYIFCCFSLLLQYIKDKKLSTLILLVLFMAITRLIKDEGLIFSIILHTLLLFTWLKSRNFSHLFFSFLWILPILQWEAFKYFNHINFTIYSDYTIKFSRVLPAISYVVMEFLNIRNWNLIWILLFFTLPFILLKKKISIKIAAFFIAIQLCSYILVFLLSPYEPHIHVPNVIDRLLLHFAPLAIYIIAIIV